jgi:hypothetical protein
MPTKDRARQPSGRRLPGRAPPKRLAAVSRRRSKHPGLRAAALAARLRPKRSSARSKPGFLVAVGKAFGEITSGVTHERSRRARAKKRLAALLTGGGALAATAAFIRRRGRQQRPEPAATEPAPQTTAPTPEEEGDGGPAGKTTDTRPV